MAAVGGVIVAAVGGYLGFKEWQRELHGKTKYHAARKVLEAAYRVEETFKAARSPSFRVDGVLDTQDRFTQSAMMADEIEQQYRRRLDRLGRAQGALTFAERRAQVVLGPDVVDTVRPLHNVIIQLATAAEVYFPAERRRILNDERRDEIPGLVDEHRELVGTHEITDRLAAALRGIEDRFRPYVR